MALKCCSKTRMAKKKASFDKATKAANKAANKPLGPDGRFTKKPPVKKAAAKKHPGKPAKPCKACGKAAAK